MEKRNQEITEYFSKYEPEKIKRLETIRILIHESIPEINEKMWTKVPCFYIGKVSIVIRVFGDHINFITDTVVQYKDELLEYKITPKGMLQILHNSKYLQNIEGREGGKYDNFGFLQYDYFSRLINSFVF